MLSLHAREDAVSFYLNRKTRVSRLRVNADSFYLEKKKKKKKKKNKNERQQIRRKSRRQSWQKKKKEIEKMRKR